LWDLNYLRHLVVNFKWLYCGILNWSCIDKGRRIVHASIYFGSGEL